jgi:hypothetical protein
MFVETDRQLLMSFVEYLERVGRAQSTQVAYATVIEDLLTATAGSIATLTAAEVDAYLSGWRSIG